MPIFKKFILPTRSDQRFSLTPIELKDYIDFEVKRLYYLYDIKEASSQHCHKIEHELFICAAGAFSAVIDQGKGLEELLMRPNEAILVPAYVWHGFKDAAEGALIIALSSTNYNPSREDYIDNYEEYINLRREGQFGTAVS